jgi:hypothetical protein
MTNVYNPLVKYRTAEGWFDVATATTTTVEFPTATNVGVDAIEGWIPTTTIGSPEAGELVQFSETGGVLQDTRIYGALMITAAHVTVRRCEVIGGVLSNGYGNTIGNDLLVEDCTVKLDPPGVPQQGGEFTSGYSAIGDTGMLVRRTAILDHIEGFRLGGSTMPLRDPAYTTDAHLTRMYNCYVRITGPHPCSPIQGLDYHGDGLQAFDDGHAGVGLKVRNSTIISVDQWTTDQTPGVGDPGCGGTSCMICGTTQAQPFDIDGLLMSGAGYCYECNNGGILKNLYIVDGSWVYHPLSIDRWDLVDEATWSGYICDLDVDGQPSTIVGSIPYGYPGFGPLDPP